MDMTGQRVGTGLLIPEAHRDAAHQWVRDSAPTEVPDGVELPLNEPDQIAEIIFTDKAGTTADLILFRHPFGTEEVADLPLSWPVIVVTDVHFTSPFPQELLGLHG